MEIRRGQAADVQFFPALLGVPLLHDSRVLVHNGVPVGATLVVPFESSDGWQVWLKECSLPPGREREAVALLCSDLSSLRDGWLAVRLPPDPRLEEAFAAAGFEPVELLLRGSAVSVTATHPVRRARESDREWVLELALACLSDVVSRAPGEDRKAVLEEARIRVERRYRTLPLDDPELQLLVCQVGAYLLLDLRASEAYLDDLAVTPHLRGRGLARSLVAAAVAEWGEVWAEVSQSNPRSWKPALRAGFRLESRRWLRRIQAEGAE